MTSTFSERLKTILDETGIRQTDLCDKTGIGKSAMSQYLHGAFVPKQAKLSAIAEALGVSEGWLMGYDVSRHRNVTAAVGADGSGRFYEMTATDDSMAGAYIPKGARVVLKKVDEDERMLEALNEKIVSIVVSGGREQLRVLHTDRGYLVFTAAKSGYEPQIFDDKDLEKGTLQILGVVDRVEIRF